MLGTGDAQSQGSQDGCGELERLPNYYDFPCEHWKHLRTSNIVESSFSRVRLRTAASDGLNRGSMHLPDLENDDGSRGAIAIVNSNRNSNSNRNRVRIA